MIRTNEKIASFAVVADVFAVKIFDLRIDDYTKSRSSVIRAVEGRFMTIIRAILNFIPNAENMFADFYEKRLLFSQIIMDSGESLEIF